MKVAVDYSWMGPTGIGRMADEVLRRKPGAVDVVGIREGRPNAKPLVPAALALDIISSGASTFWSPGFMPPLVAPGCAVAVTVHDLTHLHFYGAKHKAYYNAVIRRLLRRVDVIFTVSDFTKAELRAWSGVADDRVVRVYNGVATAFTPHGARVDIGRPYILYVGNRRSYKNVRGLMAAFAKSGLARMGYVLGLTGAREPDLTGLERQLGIEGNIHYFGFVPEEQLPALYRGAQVLAFVSLYEGFGLPIIEAMACGTPVLTSSVSSMPEVAGGAALIVNPVDEAEIAAGLRSLCMESKVHAGLKEAGLRRASEFTWEAAAQSYWRVIGAL